jgi:ABC-type Fe3+/spermidine/putrescine transport system ATPase subunit
MIYVTHDQIEALSLSTRVVVMNHGIIEQSGSPEEIYERPATSFVARFVGFDNRLVGTLISASSGEARVNVNGIELVSSRLPASIGDRHVGKKVSLSFRPGDTCVTSGPGENVLEGDIDFSNYQGNTTQYAFHAAGFPLRALINGKPIAGEGKAFFNIEPGKIIIELEEEHEG